MKTLPSLLRVAAGACFLLLVAPFAHGAAICSLDDQESAVTAASPLALNIQALNQQLAAQAAARGSLQTVAPMALPGKTLLASRHDLVLQLIHENPSEIRTVMLSPEMVATLTSADPSAAALIEKEVTLEGELTASIEDDFEHQTSRTQYHLHRPQEDIRLFSASPNGLAYRLHQPVSASGVALDNEMAVDTVSSTGLSLSGDLIAPMASPATAADSAPACTTKGEQKIALIIVKFSSGPNYPSGLDQPSYWQSALFGANPSVNNFWKEVSYGQTSLSGDVLGPITLSGTYTCNTTESMRTAALSLARTMYDLSKYNRIMVTFPASSCFFGGLGTLGCFGSDAYVTHPYSFVWIPVTPSYTTSYPVIWGDLAHELGHNLGLNHASTAEFRSKIDFQNFLLGPVDTQSVVSGTVDGSGATSASTFIQGSLSEYADKYSAMGNGWTAAGPYSAQHRSNILGWIPPSDTRNVSASDSFTLAPAENGTGLRSARVLRDPVSSSWIWLEYHQPTGYYTTSNVNQFSGNDLTSGIQVHYEDGYGGEPGHTYLIDTSVPTFPILSGGKPVGSDFLKHTLSSAQTFTDPFSPIRITAGTPTASGIPVTVSYQPACATASVTPSLLSASGGTAQLSIVADPSCSYSYSANVAWLSVGDSVRNMASSNGSRTVNFTYTANSGNMRRGYIYVGGQAIPVTQASSTGVTIFPVSPSSTVSLPGTTKTFTFVWENAKGLTDNGQFNVLMDAFGEGSSCAIDAEFTAAGTQANLYLYNFDTQSFTATLPAGTAGSLSSPGCSIDTGASSFSTSGTRSTLTISIAPTAAFLGGHAMLVGISSKTTSLFRVNSGTWIVDTNATSATISPNTANQGATVAVAVRGVNTHFSSSSVVSVSGSGVTVSSTTAADATNLTANLTIAPSAATGERLLSVTTGSEVVTAPFTIFVPGSSATKLEVSATNPVPGSSVVLTATVTGGGAQPTGSVAFKDAASTLGTVALNNGKATFTTSSLSTGSHSITASYGGNGSYAASSSAAQIITVAKGSTTTTLSASSGSIPPSGSATLTATVSFTANAAPSGTITFKDGATTLTTVPLANGSATYNARGLSEGLHSITAAYSGDASFNSSTSSVQLLIVGKLLPLISLRSTAASTFPGNALTFTASLAAASFNPVGNITFTDNGTILGTSVLNNGSASYTVSSLAAGTHTITASYAENSDFYAVTRSVSVKVSDFTIAANGNITVNAGAATGNTATLSLAPAAGDFTLPISLSCTGAPAASTCTVTPGAVTPNSTATTATVTVATTARPTGAGLSSLALFSLPLFGIPAVIYRRRLGFAVYGFALAAMLGLGLGISGCGGGAGGTTTSVVTGTPAGTGTLTVTATATDGAISLTHTTSLSLTVR